MKNSSISIRKAFNFAWATFQEHYALFAAIVLTLFGSWIALEIVVIAGQRLGLGIGLWLVAHLLFFILFAGLEVGFLQVSLALHDGYAVSFVDTFAGLSLGIRFLSGQLIYTAIVLLGSVLLIVPGIYLGIRYSLFSFLLAAKNGRIGPVVAFRRSAELSRGAERSLFSLLLIQVILNVLGASLVGLGLIITVPLSVLMMTSAYRQLERI